MSSVGGWANNFEEPNDCHGLGGTRSKMAVGAGIFSLKFLPCAAACVLAALLVQTCDVQDDEEEICLLSVAVMLL